MAYYYNKRHPRGESARGPSLLEISSLIVGNLEIYLEIYIRIVKFGVEICCCLRESLLQLFITLAKLFSVQFSVRGEGLWNLTT